MSDSELLSQEELALCIEIFKANGYKGWDRKAYWLDGGSTSSEAKVQKSLFLKPIFRQLGNNAYIKIIDNPDENYALIFREMRKLTYGIAKMADKDSQAENREALQELADRVVFARDITAKNKDDQIFVIDPDNAYVVQSIHPRIFMDLLGIEPKALLSGSQLSSVVFRPDVPFSTVETEIDKVKITCYNTFIVPSWYKLGIDHPGSIPEIFKTIFENVFPEEEDREYVYDWLHYVLMDRAQTILVCAGQRGIGKNIIFEHILGGLLGKHYLAMASQNILDGQFNGIFEGHRLVIFDEVRVKSKEAVDNLKRWSNDHIPIEKKGEDQKTIKNISSMAILSNEHFGFAITPVERRFSIPRVGEDDLGKKIPHSDIGKLVEGLTNETPEANELLNQFGVFLRNRKPKNGPTIPLKGDYYYFISDMGLPEWFNELKEYIEYYDFEAEGPFFFVRDFKKKLDPSIAENMPRRMDYIAKMIDSSKVLNIHRIGTIGRAKDPKRRRPEMAITPNPEAIEALKQIREDRIAKGFIKFFKPIDSESEELL